ncbi:hypothetical protein L7F22_059763 [Adiantum nelumboides]|nr:hypothetical protein [Adiantum nelumboides]
MATAGTAPRGSSLAGLSVNGAAAVSLGAGAWSATELGRRVVVPGVSRTPWHVMPGATVLRPPREQRARPVRRRGPAPRARGPGGRGDRDRPRACLPRRAQQPADPGPRRRGGPLRGHRCRGRRRDRRRRHRLLRAHRRRPARGHRPRRRRPARALLDPHPRRARRSGPRRRGRRGRRRRHPRARPRRRRPRRLPRAALRRPRARRVLADRESLPVVKSADPVIARSVADRRSMLYEGTTVATGRGRVVVVATGSSTEVGRSTAAARANAPVAGVDERLAGITKVTTPLAIASAGAVVLAGAVRGLPMQQNLHSVVGLAVASVPEGLPFIVSAAQLASARRLSAEGALVRNPKTIEAVGRVDVLCFDKTGTLTEGRLALSAISDGIKLRPTDRLRKRQRRFLAAALRATPRPKPGERLAHLTDRAVVFGAQSFDVDPAHKRKGWWPVASLDFDPSRGYHATLGEIEGKGEHTDGDATPDRLLSVKGAPEVVIARCTDWAGTPLDDEARQRLVEHTELLAGVPAPRAHGRDDRRRRQRRPRDPARRRGHRPRAPRHPRRPRGRRPGDHRRPPRDDPRGARRGPGDVGVGARGAGRARRRQPRRDRLHRPRGDGHRRLAAELPPAAAGQPADRPGAVAGAGGPAPQPAAAQTLLAEGPEASLGKALNSEIALRAVATTGGASLAWLQAQATPFGSPQRATPWRWPGWSAPSSGRPSPRAVTAAPLVIGASAISAGALFAVVQTPGVSQFFGCTPLGPLAWGQATSSAVAATAASMVGPELVRRYGPVLAPEGSSVAAMLRPGRESSSRRRTALPGAAGEGGGSAERVRVGGHPGCSALFVQVAPGNDTAGGPLAGRPSVRPLETGVNPAMADRYVVPTEDGWQVQKKGAQRASAKAATQAEAVERATEIVSKDGGGKVVVHGTDGKVRETHTVTPGPSRRGGREGHREGERRERRAKTQSASDKASTSGKKGGRRREGDRREGRRPRAGLEPQGRRAGRGRRLRRGRRGEGGAQRQGPEGGRQGRRGGRVDHREQATTEEAAARADEAGEHLAAAGDRASTIGAGVAEEVADAGSQNAARVGQVSEAAAQRVDRAVDQAARQPPEYNPVRILGNAAQIAVKSASASSARSSRPVVRRSTTRRRRCRDAAEHRTRSRQTAGPAPDSGAGPVVVRVDRETRDPGASPGATVGQATCAGRVARRSARALVLAGAAPHAGLLAGVEGPAQAGRPDGAAAADRLGGAELLLAGTVRGEREEEFGVVVAAGRELPVHRYCCPLVIVVSGRRSARVGGRASVGARPRANGPDLPRECRGVRGSRSSSWWLRNLSAAPWSMVRRTTPLRGSTRSENVRTPPYVPSSSNSRSTSETNDLDPGHPSALL